MDDWIELRDTPYALKHFPDDFDQTLTFVSGDEGVGTQPEEEDLRKWNSDYKELMECTKNPSYGRLKCFHCLLSPDGNDPIFIGINRLVAKGLNDCEQENGPIEYPCQVVNRFQCPYERTRTENLVDENSNPHIEIEDLFKLERMAFIVELALAKARKSDSMLQIKDKQDLIHALTHRNTFTQILTQSAEHLSEFSPGQDIESILNYFMGIKDKVCLDELRFY